MAKDASVSRVTTGQLDFSGGVDSGRVTTIASQNNPRGLKPNQLAWAQNCTVRGGGISPRPGYRYLTRMPIKDLFQVGLLYQPDTENFPYLLLQVGGRTFTVRVDSDNSIHEVTIAGDPNPANINLNWACQAELFGLINDGQSQMLVWDGNVLQRITAFNPAKALLPAGGQAMDYYMGRLWVAYNSRQFMAGDIVTNSAALNPNGAGTAPYGYRDNILHNTENTYLNGGGKFIVPTNQGNIRAIKHTANLDSALGEGRLFVFTRQAIYGMNVPTDRSAWTASNTPIQVVVQNQFGATGDRAVVPINGDLFYQSIDGVRSFSVATRYFEQWGNTPISNEVTRALSRNDRSLAIYGTGIDLDNRILQSCLPVATPVGAGSPAFVVLDFDLIDSLSERLPPAWEGVWEGITVLQVFKGDYGGLQRAFAVVWSDLHDAIEIWEISTQELEDTGVEGSNRIDWAFETPSYDWGNCFALKKLETAEIWIDRLFGKVEFTAYYRNDQNPCWQLWNHWTECAARDQCEDLNPPVPCDYPTQPYKPQYRATMVLPEPNPVCDVTNGRPNNIGYTFQIRLVIKGHCRIRGILVHATPREKANFEGMVCVGTGVTVQTMQSIGGNFNPAIR